LIADDIGAAGSALTGRITCALGGCRYAWRFDQMATVINHDTGRVQASFAAVAKHYGVQVRACPPRRGNRKGVVEKVNHVAAQRLWRTLADDATPEQVQRLLGPGVPPAVTPGCWATAKRRWSVAAAQPLRTPPATPFRPCWRQRVPTPLPPAQTRSSACL
jgi:hypothetical protein